jgi:hypothetical protein
MEFTVTDQGWLRNPKLHDGYLLGLELDEGALRVRMRDIAGQAFTMRLKGLERLLSNEFREGNIIFDIQIVCGFKPDISYVRRLLGELHSSAGSPYREQHERAIEDRMQEVTEGKLTLVVIEPSYGCELVALCREVQIDQE